MFCKVIVFGWFLVAVNVCGNVVPCVTPNSEAAYCTSLFKCPILMKSLETLERSAITFFKNSLCADSSPDDVLVCCGSTGYFQSFENQSNQNSNLTHTDTSDTTTKQPVVKSRALGQKAPKVETTTQPDKSTKIVPALAEKSPNFNFKLIYILVPCVTPNVEAAYCTSLFKCPILMKSLGTLERSAIIFFKNSLCSDSPPDDVFVCCGSTGYFQAFENNSNQNPNLTHIDTTIKQPVVKSRALGQKVPKVETTTQSDKSTRIGPTLGEKSPKPPKIEWIVPLDTITTKTAKILPEKEAKIKAHRDFVKNKLLPKLTYCGLQHTDDRFYSDNATDLDEFPWLAHIVFTSDEDDDPFQFLDRCNGVLINQRYVLTSEYCGTYPESVRLGQYYTSQTVNCIENPHFPECTEPWLEVKIEEEIHRDNSIDAVWSDLTLLRLEKNVTYTDFIRPICLPLNALDEPKAPEFYTLSGLGDKENVVSVKKRLYYKPTDLNACYELDHKYKLSQKDTELYKTPKGLTPLCLIPKEEGGELMCTWDEAGPLMYSKRLQWFADGVVTRVYYDNDRPNGDRCSNVLPIGGAKITEEVLNWIMDNMRS